MSGKSNRVGKLLTAAQRGDAAAQFELAERLREGDGIRQNLDAALHWYRAAAGAGHPDAMNGLGSMLLNGMGTRADSVEAAGWYEKAAATGHVVATFNLALRYLHGDGVDLRPDLAASLLAKAAEAGYPDAVGELGTLYMLGNGVEQDYEAAAQLHALAASQGDVVSIGNLARYQQKIEELALRGSEIATFALARMFYDGIAVDRDEGQALAWFRWAMAACNAQGAELGGADIWSAFFAMTANPTISRAAERRFQDIQARAEALTDKAETWCK
jgi:uncharacterized protein